MPNIFISTSSFGKEDAHPLEFCRQGHQVSLNPHGRTLKSEELVVLAHQADALIAGTETLDRVTLEKLNRLKVISRCGVGLDNVDLEAAKERNIQVFSTPLGPTVAVAELTVGLILNLLRLVIPMDRDVREGLWKKRMGNLLKGKNVGILGFGRIGQKVAELLSPFAVQIAYYDPAPAGDFSYISKPLQDLLGWADVITLHCPPSSAPILGAPEFNLMKKGSWLVNAARGGLVHEGALYQALKTQHLAGAALDVFLEEPYAGELRNLENVILTPHIGSYAKESRIEMEWEAVRNALKGIQAAYELK